MTPTMTEENFPKHVRQREVQFGNRDFMAVCVKALWAAHAADTPTIAARRVNEPVRPTAAGTAPPGGADVGHHSRELSHVAQEIPS